MRREPPGTVVVLDNGIWQAEMGLSLATLMLPPGSSILRMEGSHVGLSRNQAAQRFKGEWLCFIDSDHEVAPDTVMRLLAWGESAVTALNVDRGFPFPPIAFLDVPRPTRRLRPWEIQEDGLQPVGTFGCGVTLIRRGCLDDVRALLDRDCEEEKEKLGRLIALVESANGSIGEDLRPYLQRKLDELAPLPLFAMGRVDPERNGEDTFFGFMARRAGHQLYVDTSIRPGHKFSAMARTDHDASIIRLPTLGTATPAVELRLAYRMQPRPEDDPEKAAEAQVDASDPEGVLEAIEEA